MELCWLDSNDLDEPLVRGALGVLEGAREVDAPQELGRTMTTFSAELTHGWDGEPFQTACWRGPHGRVGGVLQVGLPQWDNVHSAFVEVTVDPVYRRQGIGTQLFAAGLDRARAAGRALVLAGSWEPGPGAEFAKAMGLQRASQDVRRTLDLARLDDPLLERLTAEVAEAGRDYDIVPMPVPTPQDQLPALATLAGSINDAPVDDLDVEDEVFTPERLSCFELAQAARGRRLYRLVACCRSTGELAGHTIVVIDAERPWCAQQLDTSVARPHRGHRLGLALKTAMVVSLRYSEPQLRSISTWNAASNAHMIGINEALGFEVAGGAAEWQMHLTSSS